MTSMDEPKPVPGLARPLRRVRERDDQLPRTGDITPLSVLVCVGILLYAVVKSYLLLRA